MSDHATAEEGGVAQDRDRTQWQRLASSDPIAVRDPLAEVLGMVEEGDPIVVAFEDVAKAAGHACPAVAGAYRSTQLALERLYPDSLPVRSEIEVIVGGDPIDPGYGPMANVIRHITGAADESGFAGLGPVGGRANLLSFGTVEGPGRTFRFERTDTESSIVVSFEPKKASGDSEDGAGSPMQGVSKIVSGEADAEENAAFLKQWNAHVQRILEAPPEGGPFTIDP